MIRKQFYSELGKLLYAIADADGTVSKKEKNKLQELIKNELLPNEKNNDEFGTDAAYYAAIEFEIMDDMITEPEVAFESFINFIEEHKTAIDRKMIVATRKVATKLADTYYHTNKKEKQFLQTLNKKLDSILVEK